VPLGQLALEGGSAALQHAQGEKLNERMVPVPFSVARRIVLTPNTVQAELKLRGGHMKSWVSGAASALCACAFAIAAIGSTPALAQAAQIKEKPPMYTYVANWVIPRARWADMDKQSASDAKIFDKALGSGGLVGYGTDVELVHHLEGETHDSFWSGTSMAAVLDVLDELHKAGASTANVLNSATKHSDNLFVSRFYNWKPGSVKNGYTHGASYKLKAEAPEDAVETLSKALIVPLLEKMLSEGAIQQYEIDIEAIHTDAPGTFWIFYITQNADGIDKVTAAISETLKTNSLAGPAFDSVVDFTAHRDYLAHTDATYK
jgi:hypothetical protein